MLEIIVVVGLIAILITIGLLALNPAGLLADSRNRKRTADLGALINIVYRNITDNGGSFNCSTGALPTSTVNMADNNPSVGDYDIAKCLVPKYISTLPFDPKTPGAHYSGVTDYDLKYSISISSTTNRVTVSAPNAEGGTVITVTR